MVIHYFSQLDVAVVKLDHGELRIGDAIHIKGRTSDFRQTVQSMEIEHQKVSRASVGQEFGLKVTDYTREHDQVYRVGGSSFL